MFEDYCYWVVPIYLMTHWTMMICLLCKIITVIDNIITITHLIHYLGFPILRK